MPPDPRGLHRPSLHSPHPFSPSTPHPPSTSKYVASITKDFINFTFSSIYLHPLYSYSIPSPLPFTPPAPSSYQAYNLFTFSFIHFYPLQSLPSPPLSKSLMSHLSVHPFYLFIFSLIRFLFHTPGDFFLPYCSSLNTPSLYLFTLISLFPLLH